jgi:hypothetical protein
VSLEKELRVSDYFCIKVTFFHKKKKYLLYKSIFSIFALCRRRSWRSATGFQIFFYKSIIRVSALICVRICVLICVYMCLYVPLYVSNIAGEVPRVSALICVRICALICVYMCLYVPLYVSNINPLRRWRS